MPRGIQPKRIARRNTMLRAAIQLFLFQGYEKTTTASIARSAGFTPSSFFAAFENKEALLLTLTKRMFADQFTLTEEAFASRNDPLLLYGVETALQLHIAELNPALRELYVTAYSLPSTSEFIYRSMTEKLPFLFGSYMPQASAQDFYELEIASAGITRGYMAKACGPNFPMEQKLRRYLGCCFTLYGVPEDRQQSVIQTVLTMKLEDTARKLIDDTIRRADAGLE